MDYQNIIEELTDAKVASILSYLNIPFIDKGAYYIMPTYCHHHKDEEASYKLYYYKNTKMFVCYSNDGNMSIFKFLRLYYESQEYEYDWYSDIYSLIVDENSLEGFVTKTDKKYDKYADKYLFHEMPMLPTYNKGVLDCFEPCRAIEWLNDGISTKTLDRFNIKYSSTRNKIVIPHYDVNDNLVGIRGRALNEEEAEIFGKYVPLRVEQTIYKHPLSLNLYGLNMAKDNIKKYGICYIFEGEKSVLQLDSFNMPHCGVAACGSNFNKYQLKILMKTCRPKEIVICFDNEEQPHRDDYFLKLKNICNKYSNYANFSFIYDRHNITNKKDSPTDKGEQIFNKLLERRVRVKDEAFPFA